MSPTFKFYNRYTLFAVNSSDPDHTDFWLKDDQDRPPARAMFCFTLANADPESRMLKQHIDNIGHYIDQYKANINRTIEPAVTWSDLDDNYTVIKTLWPGCRYEAMRLRKDRHDPDHTELSHELIDLREYTDHELNEVLAGYGFQSTIDAITEWGYPDATIGGLNLDRTHPTWPDIAEKLVGHIIESHIGRTIDSRRADYLMQLFCKE